MHRLNATQFVMAEGSGNIGLLTVKGDTVEVELLRSDLGGPAADTVTASTVWTLEPKLSLRIKISVDPAPFRAYAVALPSW